MADHLSPTHTEIIKNAEGAEIILSDGEIRFDIGANNMEADGMNVFIVPDKGSVFLQSKLGEDGDFLGSDGLHTRSARAYSHVDPEVAAQIKDVLQGIDHPAIQNFLEKFDAAQSKTSDIEHVQKLVSVPETPKL